MRRSTETAAFEMLETIEAQGPATIAQLLVLMPGVTRGTVHSFCKRAAAKGFINYTGQSHDKSFSVVPDWRALHAQPVVYKPRAQPVVHHLQTVWRSV